MFKLPLAALIDSRDYVFFLGSMAVLACSLLAALFILAFPELRRPLSAITRAHAALFLMATAITNVLFAFSLAYDTPLLNLQKNQGPVEWSILISVLVQFYALAGFLFFQMRDLIRLQRREKALRDMTRGNDG